MTASHVLVRWAESPPKWDIMKVRHISKVLGLKFDPGYDDAKMTVGYTALVKYDRKKNTAKAKVLAAGMYFC